MIRTEYPVLGMHCAACAANVEKVARQVEGIRQASVNLAASKIYVGWVQEPYAERLRSAIRASGYDLIVSDSEEEQLQRQENEERKGHRTLLIDMLMAWGALAVLMLLMWLPFIPETSSKLWTMWAVALFVYFIPGRRYILSALKQLSRGIFSMDTLIFVSTTTAISLATYEIFATLSHPVGHHSLHIYLDAPVMIVAFVLFGKWLEGRAVGRTRSAIRSLMGLRPRFALRLGDNNNYERVSLEEVQVGDRLMVAPGSEMPVDGEVVRGQSTADEQMITGEPLPTEKAPGSMVYAGTINSGRSELIVRANSVGRDTVLGGIIRSVREAEGSKAPVQRLADRIAGVFVPIVLGLAVVTFFVWWLVGGAAYLEVGIVSAVSVVVIACPCALGLATPTAISVAVGRAARRQVLVRSAEALEHLSDVDTFVFDKTGTLTLGKPVVRRESWRAADRDVKLMRLLLYTAELRSTHPLARAICNTLAPRIAQDSQCLPDLDAYTSEPGRGVSFLHNDILYRVGSRPFVAELFTNDLPENLVDVASEVLFVSEEGFIASFDVVDAIQPSSVQAIAELKKGGKQIILLSGDRQAEASRVGMEIGADKAVGELLPADKPSYIRRLQSEGHRCAMVGDGINDSEALCEASVGIAMGSGSDIAKGVAGLVLMSPDLRALADVYLLSCRTRCIIRQNLFWALLYNIITIPIAAGLLFPFGGIVLNPGIAAAAMALSSVSVVTNSLRLFR